MKRTIALAVLVAALGVLVKLTFKPVGPGARTSVVPVPSAGVRSLAGQFETQSGPKTDLTAKYATETPEIRDLVARVADRFGRNAQAIERTDGLRGLVLLDRLDLEATFPLRKASHGISPAARFRRGRCGRRHLAPLA